MLVSAILATGSYHDDWLRDPVVVGVRTRFGLVRLATRRLFAGGGCTPHAVPFPMSPETAEWWLTKPMDAYYERQ